ncbi:MAG: type transport system ATP-binding protein [Thermoleophilaceae bacterium]|nr:type transport system ATP-binding protein [Thermoleophilaceae bacterium]
MAAAVDVSDLSVAFRLPRMPPTTLKELAIRFTKRQLDYDRIWALRDVSLTLEPGELLGVIGPNGAGKSTLVRALGGIVRPTAGRVVVRGRVTPILGLGVGLQLELTGRENIVLLGAMLGRDARVARARAGAIADWAGLSEYVDVPLRAYSAGMRARLAFAVVTDEQPDVLLLDEVLAVGDVEFHRRSLERTESLVANGATVVLVSHDLAQIADWTNRVLWLDGGRAAKLGDPAETVAAYLERSAVTAP